MKCCLIVLASVISVISGQIVAPGLCPSVSAALSFDLEKFSGTWYELYESGNLYGRDMACKTVRFEDPEGDNANYTLTMTDRGVADEEEHIFIGEATLVPNQNEAKFTVKFPAINDNETPYWILNTDYTTYATVYSCTDNTTTRTEFIWVMGRETFIDPQQLNAVYVQVTSLTNWGNMKGISHTPDACEVSSAPTQTITFVLVALSVIVAKLF